MELSCTMGCAEISQKLNIEPKIRKWQMRNWKFQVAAGNERRTNPKAGSQIRNARRPMPWCVRRAEPARVQRVRARPRQSTENAVEQYSCQNRHVSAIQELWNAPPPQAGSAVAG